MRSILNLVSVVGALARIPHQHVVRNSKSSIVHVDVDVNVDGGSRSITSTTTSTFATTSTWSANAAGPSFNAEP